MASARFAWGIDIGNRALKAIKLQRQGDGLKITDFEVIEHEQVLSAAGDNRDALVQSALAQFVQRHPTKGGVVAVGVSGQQSFARFIKLPPVETKKIPEIVRFEAIQQIPFPLDDVEWSYQLFQAPDSPEIEVGIFAMRKELVNSHIKHFTDVEMNVETVQMNPLAVHNAMSYDGRIKGTTLVVDMGAENTDLIIADADTVWLRSIPIGGNSFTESLVKAFKLNFAKAEDLKRNAATSKYARQIFQAMRPIFADLVAEIQRSIGFYSSVHRESRIKKIIALGGTFRLTGLQKYLQQNLQLEVERIDGFAAGAPAEGRTAAIFQDNLLAMVGAYGLALQAMGQAKINSSLLPAHIRRAKLWQDKTKWFATAAGVVALGVGTMIGSLAYLKVQAEQNTKTRGDVETTYRQAQDLDRRYAAALQGGQRDRQLILNISSMAEGRDLWPHILDDILGAVPSPQPAVLAALTDPAKLAQIKNVRREDRQILMIDELVAEYRADLNAGGATPAGAAVQEVMDGGDPAFRGGGMPNRPMRSQPGMTATATPAAGARRGFVVSVTLTSPFHTNEDPQGVDFVTRTFIARLKAANAAAKSKGYEFVDQTIVTVMRLSAQTERLTKLDARWKLLTDAGASAATAGSHPDPMVPDEVVDQDVEFKVTFKVVLVEQPQKK